VRMARPYYLCSQCHVGQFPVDVELDIENTELSPGVPVGPTLFLCRRFRLVSNACATRFAPANCAASGSA
jgi:hypothetical protein